MIQHLRNATTSLAEQRKTLDFLNKLNGLELAKRGADPLLEGRIQSMEVAYRMQAEAMDAFDISKEPAKVQAAYRGDAQSGRSRDEDQVGDAGRRLCAGVPGGAAVSRAGGAGSAGLLRQR
jgi:hypothetical protein